jgi:hypothetical protein
MIKNLVVTLFNLGILMMFFNENITYCSPEQFTLTNEFNNVLSEMVEDEKGYDSLNPTGIDDGKLRSLRLAEKLSNMVIDTNLKSSLRNNLPLRPKNLRWNPTVRFRLGRFD